MLFKSHLCSGCNDKLFLALQVRVEMQYKGSLSLPMTMEVHAINDATYSKVAAWLPDSDKMQAELEGNRISRHLNVRPPIEPSCLPFKTPAYLFTNQMLSLPFRFIGRRLDGRRVTQLSLLQISTVPTSRQHSIFQGIRERQASVSVDSGQGEWQSYGSIWTV